MPHDTPLISTIVIGLVLAFGLGVIAQRMRISPLVGYLLAGVLMGPFTPGYVADQALANELAEIGIILLMFGVGLHFSLNDLLSVRAIALPGAIGQIAVATLLGMALAWALGWTTAAGLVFGLALSVASTVVLLRAMQERRLVETERGRIAIGWLIVEDLAMVFTLVLLPALSGALKDGGASAAWTDFAIPLAITLGKVIAFIGLMLIVGRRVIPWCLHYVAHTGSRELFRLAVLGIALGVAYGAATLFDVSFALGAFFAGMVLSESELSQRAANETLPLRDAFAVLFFVSVGMLFDPMLLINDPLPVLATILIITIGKSLAAFAIVRAFRHPTATALTISASLAQIGEFSFILAALGSSLGILPDRARGLIIAGAILSILLNPVLFAILDRVLARRDAREADVARDAQSEEKVEETTPTQPIPVSTLMSHAVLIGHGRVGRRIAEALISADVPLLVIEAEAERLTALRDRGIATIVGNAADPEVGRAANLGQARILLVAIPDAFEGGQVVQQARAANPGLPIIARAHSDEEIAHLDTCGASQVIMGEFEIAKAMVAAVVAPVSPTEPKSAPTQPSGPA